MSFRYGFHDLVNSKLPRASCQWRPFGRGAYHQAAQVPGKVPVRERLGRRSPAEVIVYLDNDDLNNEKSALRGIRILISLGKVRLATHANRRVKSF